MSGGANLWVRLARFWAILSFVLLALDAELARAQTQLVKRGESGSGQRPGEASSGLPQC